MSGPVDDDTVRALGAKKRGLRATRVVQHDTRVAQVAGKRLNEKWAQQFVKKYKYVFTDVPIQGREHVRPSGFPGEPPKPKEWRLATAIPEADVVFGDSLDDLNWFDSKAKRTSSLTSAQRLNYPKINQNGGIINWDKAGLPVNKVDGKPVDLHGRKIAPNRGHIAYSVDLSAVASGQRDLVDVLEERRGQIKPGPKPTPYLNLEDSRMITDRGLVAKKPIGKPTIPEARVVSGAEHLGEGAVKFAARGFKARLLVIGVKAWRAARTVSNFAFHCFIPMTPVDILIEVTLWLGQLIDSGQWPWEREKEEKKRREKQRALEAVFREGGNWIDQAFGKKPPPSLSQLIDLNILKNAKVQDQFMKDWDGNKGFNGFQYARVTAIMRIESYRDMRGEDDESLRSYSVESRDVYAVNAGREFELEDIGEEQEVDKTEAEIKTLLDQKGAYASSIRKMIMRKRLRYTIVPPLLTPYDIVIAKMNNLFVDIVQFTAAFTGAGGEILTKDFSFDYRYPEWQTQFQVLPDFATPPLNRSVCEYCLGYLYYSAKLLSHHPLEQQDLESNFEAPRKGWKRRFWLLTKLLEGSNSAYSDNFSRFAQQVKRLVRRGEKDEEIVAALDELYGGARAIWYDLERIEKNLHQPEYYYFGPQYVPSD